MDLRGLRWAVPVAILAVGYWLLAPLVAPAIALRGVPVAEAPVVPTRVAPPKSASSQVSVATARPSLAGTAAASPAPPASAAPAGPTTAPAAAASPTPSLYRASPIENLKIEPRATELVRLGRIEQGTPVRMTVSVRFNVGLSSISGVPDVDVQVVGPSGTVASYPGARDGVKVTFEAGTTGEYELRLDNTRSRINAKRVTVQFG